ncbi:hypothetical protein GCM10027570_47630 [Streptomonospora sediminis]
MPHPTAPQVRAAPVPPPPEAAPPTGAGRLRRRAAALLAGACCALLLCPAAGSTGAAAYPGPPAAPVAGPPPPHAPVQPGAAFDAVFAGDRGASATPDVEPPGAHRKTRADTLADRVNRVHTASGCERLRRDDRLDAAARGHARGMARRGELDHTGNDGGGPGDRAAAKGYRQWSGELIAAGQQSADQTLRAWRTSAGHRRILLDCGHSELGTGVVEHSGRLYWTLELGRG